MITLVKFSIMVLVPVITSVLVYYLDKKTSFKNLKHNTKQIIVGGIFGLIAICNTEFGVAIEGAKMNVRDAAPLCAGLLFGGPAGIIAGVIGGVERYFASFWGAGMYTQVACSLSAVLAGVVAAILRKYMFDNKKPSCFYGLAIAVVVEVVHMLSIFMTNMNDVKTAYSFVEQCSKPMIILNGISVFLAIFSVSFMGKQKSKQEVELKKLSQTFQHGLLICISIAFLATTSFSWVLQTQLSKGEAVELLKLNIKDVRNDIADASDENLLNLTHEIADEINNMSHINSKELQTWIKKYDVAEINIVDKDGIIIETTYEPFLNYDMGNGEQSKEFLVLLDGKTTEYVQKYQPTSLDSSVYRKYAGTVLERGGFVQVAYDAEHFQEDIDHQVIGVTRNRHVGDEGCIIIANENWKIVSDRNNNEGKKLENIGIYIDTRIIPEGELFIHRVYGEDSYCMYMMSEGYYAIAVLPVSEVVFSRNVSVYITVFMELLVFGALFVLVYFLIKTHIVDNIQKINRSLAEITGGNLDVVVDVRGNEEFASLSDDINSTVVTLKRYIAEAAARIDKELEFARTIQHSALPTTFPPYPNKSEFDIYATMDTAKEVGGDFYDFYLLGEDKLAFLIADVSGKGIPAAMFMMTAKTLIKSLAEAGYEVNEILTLANEKLCANNEADMFVTVWMGILDVNTGKIEFANAGHNPPLVRLADGKFEFLKSKPGLVLAGMDGMKYRKNEIQLSPGDEIYLYTDGVTEAVDMDNKLYGEQRLVDILNINSGADMKTLCKQVKEDVDRFAGEAPQFDDITMLSLKFEGCS